MINVRIEVFKFDARAQRKVMYTISTECNDIACLDLGALQSTMRFLYPRMDGLTVTIM